jgi:DNA primase
LEALQKAVSAGGASDAEKTRMVWLVAEVQRRRQLGLRPATADGA